jgi:hypothetical protein
MRTLAAGLVLLILAIGLSEYARRHPRGPEEVAAGAAAPANPLLETLAPAPDDGAASPEAFGALLATGGTAAPGFVPVVHGAFAARRLVGGFGAVLFLVDAAGGTALVRAAVGEGGRVVAARKAKVGALHLDGSLAFFAQGSAVLSIGARGGEPVEVRARFKQARVSSLCAGGDTVFVTLRPVSDADADGPTGAVARIERDGQVSLVAGQQTAPGAVACDAKDVFWVAGGALWRAPRDGSYASRVAGDAAGPLVLDGDALLFLGTDGGLRRVARAGGAPVAVAPAPVRDFVSVSGLVRYTTDQGLFEVTPGAEPRSLLAAEGGAQGVAVAGTSLYLLAGTPGATSLLARP